MALEKCISTCRKLKLDPYFSPCAKINSIWIKDFNERPQTLKLLDENTGKILQDVSIGNDFLNIISKAKERTRIDE
jgi:hypothetical protein